MARRNTSKAYDLRDFEQSIYDDADYAPKKKESLNKGNNEETHKSKKNKVNLGQLTRRQRQKGNRIFNISIGVLFGLVLVILVVSIINGQVQLTELNQKIIDSQQELAEEQSRYTQLEMKIDANLSTAVIEKYAQEKLGMTKASNSQKEFINLSQGDKAEVIVDTRPGLFESIANAFSSLWS